MNDKIRERIEKIRRGEVPEGYKRDGDDIIPLEWYKTTFSELGKISSGLVDPRKEPYIHMQHIGPDNIEKDTGQVFDTKEVSELGLISGKFYFDADSIVYSKIRPNLNKVCVPTFEGVCSADCYSIKPNDGVDKKYLFNLMLSFPFYKHAVACSMRTGMPKINQDDLNVIPLCLPTSIEEQKRIVTILDAQDHAIELQKQKLNESKRLKRAYMDKMFPRHDNNVPEIRFVGFTDPWERRKLGEIADKVIEKNVDLQYIETFTNSAEFGIMSQRDFFDHDIAKMESLNGYYIVRSEDFVYNPRISTSAPVGPINRNKLGRTGVVSPLYTVFRPHDIDLTYLEHFFKCEYWHSFMNFNGDSGARSDRFSIKDNVFFQMPIPIPHIDEQKKVGEFLTHLDDLITFHQRKLDEMKKLKKGLMQLLLTGIVRVGE